MIKAGMKIAFLQEYPFPCFGVMSLSACLPQEYRREVFIGDLGKDAVSEVIRPRPGHILRVLVLSLGGRS